MSDSYEAIQHSESSWSHDSVWGLNAIDNARVFHDHLIRSGALAEDDVFADFGGNDGTVAAQWQQWNMAMGWPATKALSVDMDSIKQHKGKNLYPSVEFVNGRLESIGLPDAWVDWGYCSHTLEHVEDVAAAFAEIARVTARGLYVVVPVETDAFRLEYNPAHLRASEDIEQWKAWLNHPDMTLHLWGKPLSKNEFHLLFTKAQP